MTPPAPKFFARRVLSALARVILRARSRPFPLETATVTLVLAPHQDDETLGCGGLITLILEAGHQVHITYLTDGSGSHPGYPNLAARRHAEALAATARLGVSQGQIEFIDAPDGSLAHLAAEESAALVSRLAATLTRIQPTVVLLPCRADGSSEHDASHALFIRALASTTIRPRIGEFPVWSWWNPLLLKEPMRRSRHIWRASFPNSAGLKQRALAAYATQLQPLESGLSPMLTKEFISFFASPEEFFFEY